MGRVVFQGIIFQHKCLNLVWKLIRNSEMGYYYLFKNNRLLFLLLFSLLFCNLEIPKQGIEMQLFFLNGLWKFLKNGHLPVKLHSSAPPGPKSKSQIHGLLNRHFVLTNRLNHELPDCETGFHFWVTQLRFQVWVMPRSGNCGCLQFWDNPKVETVDPFPVLGLHNCYHRF